VTVTEAETQAMRRALVAAREPPTGSRRTPAVGCVLLGADGGVLAVGRHRGPGTAHAEVDALAQVGGRAPGATAVVTLEPCDHTGRTGTLYRGLLDAGVTRVVHAIDDPDPWPAVERRRCAPPASRSSRACWPTRRVPSTRAG
jgi:diaminohydroxyphosphoribosylaminopyrimidine deaminase/5-amino-6-(5-phosphoribosylamino)uracil reductase